MGIVTIRPGTVNPEVERNPVQCHVEQDLVALETGVSFQFLPHEFLPTSVAGLVI